MQINLSLADIRRECSSAIYSRGKNCMDHGLVYDVNVAINGDELVVNAVVQGEMTYESQLILNSMDGIGNYQCTCPAFGHEDGACKHIVATYLYFLRNHQSLMRRPESAPNDYGTFARQKPSDRWSGVLLEAYEKKLEQEVSQWGEEVQSVQIVPTLVRSLHDREFSIEATIGVRKFYVLKDWKEFYQQMLNGSEVNYGKELTVVHQFPNFTEKSQKLIDLAMKIQELSRGSIGYTNRRQLPLPGGFFDEFFSLFQGQILMCQIYDYPFQAIHLTDEDPRLNLELRQVSREWFELRLKSRYSHIIDYGGRLYIIEGDRLHRCSDTYHQEVGPLLGIFAQKKDNKLTFTVDELKQFLALVYPKIKEYVPVDLPEQLAVEHMPPPLTTNLYFDYEGNDVISCHGTFVYGEQIYDVFALSQPLIKDDFQRNIIGEKRIKGLLRKYGFVTKGQKAQLSGEDGFYRFFTHGIQELEELAQLHMDAQLNKVTIKRAMDLSVGLRISNNLLDFRLLDEGLEPGDLAEILAAYRVGKKYVKLKSNSFLEINEQEIGTLANIVDDLQLDVNQLEQGELQLPAYRALYVEQLLQGGQWLVERDRNYREFIDQLTHPEQQEFHVPEGLDETLRNYQVNGFRWLKTLSHHGLGGILADDMGLGKTLQIIALLVSEQNGKPSIVVAPTSLVYNWQRELEKFAPQLRYIIVSGKQPERQQLIESIDQYQVVITSYDLLRRDIGYYADYRFQYCIADEAQYIKNQHTQNAQSLKALSYQVGFALSGTPMENSLADLWSIFDFVLPNFLYTYRGFKERYEVPIVKRGEPEPLRRLQKQVAPFILRRLKKEVLLELPEKTETIMYAEMSNQERKLYLAHLAKAHEEFNREMESQGFNKGRMKILALLTRLRQLCCHPSLFLENFPGNSAKLNLCLELVEQSIGNGHKVLIFSQFTSMLQLIAEQLEKKDIGYYVLTGETKSSDRIAMVETFNEDDTPIFLISLKAGGVGLNLTSADVVIHYDPWWNQTAENQATDRAHRIGQKNNVQVLKLIAKDSIEEKIQELQQKKMDLTQAVVQEGETFITSLGEDEISSLFSLE